MGGDSIPGPLDHLRDMEKGSITAILSSSLRLIKMRPPERYPSRCPNCTSTNIENFPWRLVHLGLHTRDSYCQNCDTWTKSSFEHP